VVYLNVPTETHTTCFNRHHRCFDRQSCWRHPDALLLAPTRSEITPPPLTSCLFGKCWSAEKCHVDVFSVIRRKMVKTHRRKSEQGLPKMGGTSETSTQSLQHFDSSAVKNKKQNALPRKLGVSRHCAHQHCSIQGEWRQ
jgi:hypothetical protein